MFLPVYICNSNVKYHRFHSTLENITHRELDTVGNLMSNHRLRYQISCHLNWDVKSPDGPIR